MRCRKPCQRWGMKSLTRPPRPFFAQGLKHRDSFRHHPKRQCGLRMCLVYLYLFISCVQLRLSSEDFQRNFQGVSSAPGSAQHEQSVQDVSFASGRRPQLRRLGTCKCAAWAQRAGCILCTWTRARLAAGHANLRAYTPRGRGSTRHGAATMRCGVTACGRGGAVALGTLRETWHGR